MRFWYCKAEKSSQLNLRKSIDSLEQSVKTSAPLLCGDDQEDACEVLQKNDLRTFKVALEIHKIRLKLHEQCHEESEERWSHWSLDLHGKTRRKSARAVPRVAGPTWEEWKKIDPYANEKSDALRAFLGEHMRLRTLKVAFKMRMIRLASYNSWGEALAGPTWQEPISQMLQQLHSETESERKQIKLKDANEQWDEFLAFREKLLIREKRDPSNDNLVSMLESASRFLPLFDQRSESGEILDNGQGQQCTNHGLNNITSPCTRLLDHEILQRLIQAIKCVKNIHNEDELIAAINHFFSERPEIRRIDEDTDFFKRVREGIAEQARAGLGLSLDEAKKEMGYTDEKGAKSAETCAIVRWSTTTKSGDWMASQRLGYSAGFLRIGAVALDPEDEVKAVVAVFSRNGFQSKNFPHLMLESKVAESFEFLTGSRTLFQLYLVAFLHRFIFKPLMALVSADNECADLMGGMNGIPRRMLAVLRRGIFVGVGGKWSRRLAHGHRTNGAEYKLSLDSMQYKGSVRLLNPKCSAVVSRMLGDDWDGPMLSAIKSDAVGAMDLLVTRMRSLAIKQDPVMPQDSERIFQELDSMAALLADPKRDTSFALRMVQMQFLAMEVISDTARSLEYCCRQGLQGLRTFIAGMMRTKYTDDLVRLLENTPDSPGPEGQLSPAMRRINYAHPMALADGVITLKMCEEITHELKEKISEVARKRPDLREQLKDKDPADFLPAFVANTFSRKGQNAIRQWLGVSEEQKNKGEWGAHYNRVDSLDLVDCHGKVLPKRKRVVQLKTELPDLDSFEWIQALHRGFDPWWLRQNASIFRSYWNQVAELPKPLQEFPAAYLPSRRASNMAPSSKSMEQHWATPALMFDTRSRLANHTLSHFFVLPAFRHPDMEPASLAAEAPPYKIRCSQEMAQFKRMAATFEVDKEKRSVMKEDAHRKLAAAALKSKSGGWPVTNHGAVEYRRPGHSEIDPGKTKGKTHLNRLSRIAKDVAARKHGYLGVAVAIKKKTCPVPGPLSNRLYDACLEQSQLNSLNVIE